MTYAELKSWCITTLMKAINDPETTPAEKIRCDRAIKELKGEIKTHVQLILWE